MKKLSNLSLVTGGANYKIGGFHWSFDEIYYGSSSQKERVETLGLAIMISCGTVMLGGLISSFERGSMVPFIVASGLSASTGLIGLTYCAELTDKIDRTLKK